MPALPLDVAFVHANRADARGNAQYLGPDWFFDDLFCMAAKPPLRDRPSGSSRPADFLAVGLASRR